MAQSPDRDATFNRIFHRHHEAVQIYCLRRLPVDDVNDAVAEVFLVAWRRIDEMPDGKELPWLYRIGMNVIRNARRSHRRRGNLRQRLAGLRGENQPGPETQLVRHYEERAVLDALFALSRGDQEILRLRTWEELSNGEIAEVLGTSVHAVDMRISRAKKHLVQAYEKSQRRSAAATTSPRFVEEGGER